MTAPIFFVIFHMKLQKKWGHSFSYHFIWHKTDIIFCYKISERKNSIYTITIC